MQFGGTFQGKGSCDRNLADHPEVATLAAAALPALVAHGLPTVIAAPLAATPGTLPTPAASPIANRPEGLAQYLVKSAAFRSNVVYILTCVPDPTTRKPNAAGGSEYQSNVCAISATTAAGTVLFSQVLSPTSQ